MSGSPPRIISDSELAQLAEIFDLAEYADDPTSESCREAVLEFDSLVEALYEEVKGTSPQITYTQFWCGIRKRCRAYLKKNL